MELNVYLQDFIMDWPNSLDCTDLCQCGARRDAELCRLCYKQMIQKIGQRLKIQIYSSDTLIALTTCMVVKS